MSIKEVIDIASHKFNKPIKYSATKKIGASMIIISTLNLLFNLKDSRQLQIPPQITANLKTNSGMQNQKKK